MKEHSEPRTIQLAMRYLPRLVLYSFAGILVELLIAPFHEVGHVVIGLLLGVQILGISWASYGYISPYDWRENIMGLSGGFFTVLLLSFLYLLVENRQRVSVKGVNERKSEDLLSSRLLGLRIILLGNLMFELASAFLEGLEKEVYDAIVSDPLIAIALSVVFTGVSFYVHGLEVPTIENTEI